MHISPKTLTCSCGRTLWLQSLPREFSAGCLLRVIRLLPCSNAWRFACVCAVAYWRHLLIFCDSLFLPRKKIGKRAAKSATTVCSTHCAARSAWRESIAAAAKTDLHLQVSGGFWPRTGPAKRRRSLLSLSSAAATIGRTFPPTPRRAETPLPASEKLSENAPLPPTRSPARAHFHPWLAEASAPPPLLRIAQGQNPTHAVVATAAKIACPLASTVESGERRLWPVHKSSFPSAKCNLH